RGRACAGRRAPRARTGGRPPAAVGHAGADAVAVAPRGAGVRPRPPHLPDLRQPARSGGSRLPGHERPRRAGTRSRMTTPTRAEDFRRVAVFDVVVNNADRKAGHCLLDADGRIWLVDHGVCFAVEPKLRTVIWEFAGEPIPPELCADLQRLSDDVRHGPLLE